VRGVELSASETWGEAGTLSINNNRAIIAYAIIPVSSENFQHAESPMFSKSQERWRPPRTVVMVSLLSGAVLWWLLVAHDAWSRVRARGPGGAVASRYHCTPVPRYRIPRKFVEAILESYTAT
jgi:hypothetical protein